jgi:hypothetical protein
MPGPKVANRMPQMVEDKQQPGRPKLPIQMISVDELLSIESASGSLANTGRPRLRKPSAASAGPAPKASPAGSELPPGWVAMKDEEGDIFYYNQTTGAWARATRGAQNALRQPYTRPASGWPLRY